MRPTGNQQLRGVALLLAACPTHRQPETAELQNPPDGSRNMVILCKIKLINIYEVMNINYKLEKVYCIWSTRSTKSTKK